MKTPIETADLLGNLIMAVVLLAIIFALTQCAPQAFPPGTPNPLDLPAMAHE